MKVVTRIFLGFVAILLCGITACQVHYYKARRTPAVAGKVVDIETGEPIKGADVSVQVFGFPSNPIAAIASPPKWQLAGDMLKTDSQGSFSFPSQVPPLEDSGVSWWSYILWGPNKQTGIGVNVYTKDHITVASDSEGFEWKLDDFYETYFRGENNEKLVTVERERKGERSFEYTIKVKTAKTERDWEIKCKDTILHTGLGREPDETWVFNDLVGYLERFPEGEKAGDYVLLLLDRIAHGDSEANIDWGVSSGELDQKAIPILIKRNEKIIELASKITPTNHPGEVVTFSNYEQRIKSVKNCTFYLKKMCVSGEAR